MITCSMSIHQSQRTALHWASENGHNEVVRVLLAAKATVNTQDKVSFPDYLGIMYIRVDVTAGRMVSSDIG